MCIFPISFMQIVEQLCPSWMGQQASPCQWGKVMCIATCSVPVCLTTYQLFKCNVSNSYSYIWKLKTIFSQLVIATILNDHKAAFLYKVTTVARVTEPSTIGLLVGELPESW